MRGHDEQTAHMFSYLSPEQRVPADHPLRAVRALTDEALQTMSRRFASLYATTGRPSIPPEQLLRALLLQVLYTVRSERLLMEELNDNLLFRWFVGLNMDDPVWQRGFEITHMGQEVRDDCDFSFQAEMGSHGCPHSASESCRRFGRVAFEGRAEERCHMPGAGTRPLRIDRCEHNRQHHQGCPQLGDACGERCLHWNTERSIGSAVSRPESDQIWPSLVPDRPTPAHPSLQLRYP